MRRLALLFAFLVATLGSPLGAIAVAEDGLAGIAAAEAEAFRVVSEQDVAGRRDELLSRSAELNTAISRLADGGYGWHTYLKWDAVVALADAGSKPDLAALQACLERLESGADGLELPAFRNAADALRRYLDTATLFRAKQQARAYGSQLASIPKLLDREPLMDPRVGYQLERRLDLVAGLGQAPRLVSAVRDRYDGSNVLISVSESMLDRMVRRPVVSTDPVRDCILGARVVGTGSTNAVLTVDLRPSHHAARLDFNLRGAIHSETTGYKGPVAVRSAADTPISAVKTVELTPSAFYVMPASASATTRSRTRSIRKVGGGLGSRIIERIAADRANEQRGLADRIAAGRVEGRISAKLNTQIDESAADLRRQFDKFWTKPLARYGASPERFGLSTTERSIDAALLQAGRGQLGADSPAPAASAGDAVVRLHASAVHNLATSLIGGATVAKTEAGKPPELSVTLPSWLSELLPEKSSSSGGEEEKDFRPWSLTLRRVRPLSIVIGQGTATVTAHTAKIDSGGSTYRGWDLILEYRAELVDGRWRLERQGEIDVLPSAFDPAAGKPLKGRQVGLRRNLAKAINEGAADSALSSIELAPIDLARLDRPGLAWLAFSRVELADGWATIAWDAL